MRVFRSPTRAHADAATRAAADDVVMSYAVLWSDNGGPTMAGKLELRERDLVLDGANGHGVRITLAFVDIASARIGRSPGERLQGRPVLVLDDATGRRLRVATLSGVGALHEVADVVEARQLDGTARR